MDGLTKLFSDVYEKYENKRTFFKEKISQWELKGETKLFEQAKPVFDELEKEAAALKDLLSGKGVLLNEQDVKKRIKEFKKKHSRLIEITKSSARQWVEAILIAGSAALILRIFVFGLYCVPSGSAEPRILVGDRVWGNKMAYRFGSVKRGDLIIFDSQEFKYSQNPILYFWERNIGIAFLGLPPGPDNITKRVIGLPGDWIEGRVDDGKPVIYLNGTKLDEPYLNPYPLVKTIKTVGMLPFTHIGPIPLPSFLCQRIADPSGTWCTFDPNKSLEDQPFYNIEKNEIILNSEGYYVLRRPQDPSYKNGYDNSNGYADVFGPFRIPEGKYWCMGDNRRGSYDARWFGFVDGYRIHGRASFVIWSLDSREPIWFLELLKNPIKFFTKYLRWNRFFKKL